VASELAGLFTQLTGLLSQNQHYWRPVAFHQKQLPWMVQHPLLVERLYALSLEEIDQLASCSLALNQFLANEFPFADELSSLCQLEHAAISALPEISPHFYTGMPGRKWQQVNAFARCFEPISTNVLEWCAGKSYLGFYLQHLHQTNVLALEWDEKLVEQANMRAKQYHIPLSSHCIDVLSPAARAYIKHDQQVVALHACGELHERLLQLSVEAKVLQLQLAPCCYHKRHHTNYQPLSALGCSLDLKLNKSELHTAVMETVTAGATLQRQRKQLQIMRLGFDCLQRELHTKDKFLAIPSLPTSWAKADFSDFCRHCAALKNITLPDAIDWSYYLQQGQYRFKQVSALDLVRFLFRRPLEVWLALDRALLLEEKGYEVSLNTFCANHITPRNILIKAKLKA
jgi:hypothetical protein